MRFDDYIFRSHYQGSLVSVPKPLTEKQSETLFAYRDRQNGIGRPLTENQKKDWHSLEHKFNESKVYKLSTTAQNILTDIVFFEQYGRKYTLENKYFSKGLEVEKSSRDLISQVLAKNLTRSNVRKSNEWVSGEIDIEPQGVIIDIKSSYSFTSFNKHLIDDNIEFYKRQLDCYMELWGLAESLIAFTLVDTPARIVEDELRRLNWKETVLNLEGEVYEQNIPDVVKLVSNHIYTRKALEEFCQGSGIVHIEWFDEFVEIPEAKRVHLVPHYFEKERIEQRNESLKLCREFMNTVKPMNNLTI